MSNQIENATDSYTGIVSFRAERKIDVDRLLDRLTTLSSDSFHLSMLYIDARTKDVHAAMTILFPLTIAKLRNFMDEISDSHVMGETLRSVPASCNSMTRRYDFAKGNPECWSSD